MDNTALNEARTEIAKIAADAREEAKTSRGTRRIRLLSLAEDCDENLADLDTHPDPELAAADLSLRYPD